jgi:hypothetical protein
MFIVNIQGGLGNQLFQYALAKSLEIRRNTTVLLDPTPLNSRVADLQPPRTYGLDLFNTRVQLLKPADSAQLLASAVMICRITERYAAFRPELLEQSEFPVTILDGYWQSERYFVSIADMLRKHFTLKREAPRDTELLAAVHRPNALCVHVRRQDYLRAEGAHLGFVGVDYFRRAVRELADRVPQAHFLVFSDEPDWCRQNLALEHPHTFVDYRPGLAEAAGMLMVMSRCRHFIISNSTYSWWAAWLGSAADKIVIAPSGWFSHERSGTYRAGRDIGHRSKDLTPNEWIRL